MRWWAVPSSAPARRRRAALLVATLALLALGLWSVFGRAPASVTVAAGPPPPAAAAQPFFGPVPAPAPPAPDQGRRLRAQLQLAERTYCSYLAATRYPPGSRPMRENADQDRSNDPVLSTGPMRLSGDSADDSVRLQTSQSRVWLGAGESAVFMVRAVDAAGAPLPLDIGAAVARGLAPAGQGGQAALAFADDGAAPDAVARDGVYSAMLDPARGALAGFEGTIRTELRYRVGGREGVVQFDVIHTPEVPAVWAGPVREVLEQGSLNYYLKLAVRQGGRYVVSGRLDDARGQAVALLTFNEVLAPGLREIRLVAFGRLLRDQRPALPLTLRDVEGYLLKDGVDPDRALLPRLQGRVFTGQEHDAARFSAAEWRSEERSRHLAEFSRDLARARAGLAAFDPAAQLPPTACPPAPEAP